MPRSKTSSAVTNAFAGSSKAPEVAALHAALGAAVELWNRLLAELEAEFGLGDKEWKTSSPKLGWSLRIKRGDRIIVYLAPLAGSFRASFVLGHKAVQTAKAAGLSPAVLQSIESARSYAEGTPVRIDVRGPQDLTMVKKLVQAKLSSKG